MTVKQKSYDLEHKLRSIVTARTKQYVASGQSIGVLANKAGLARSTVSKLAYNETKYPRFHTVLAVCDVLGVQLQIVEQPQLSLVVGKRP